MKKGGVAAGFILLLLLNYSVGFSQVNKTGKLVQRLIGNPLEHLPSNIEILTHFGERADISPDSRRIAFMAKTFGDAMIIDIKTRDITCLTCAIPAAAFLRVMHLANGDYLLIGPAHFENLQQAKKESELWYLSKAKEAKPVPLGIKTSAGVAVSKKQLKIVYTIQNSTPKITSQLVLADIAVQDSVPKLKNQKTVLQSSDKTCSLEAQDFFDGDTKLTYFCYIPNGSFNAMGLDLVSGYTIDFSGIPGHFNEPEGIFPDEKCIAVESDRQCDRLGGQTGSANIDIWKLKLDSTGKNMVRLTHFNDYEGGKAANPVVAGNGKFMAFQYATSTSVPGSGNGILLYWFIPPPQQKHTAATLYKK